ncbi:MAG: glycosyltransferase [Pseudonocardiaceae bacterium]
MTERASTSPPVLLAVVTYNSAPDLPELLQSLPAALQGVPDWQLVIADNASTDGTPELARRLAPAATVLTSNVNRGYAAGLNACAALAGAEHAVLSLNADVQLGPGSVRALLDACTDGITGVAVPVVHGPDGEREPTLRRRPTALRAWGEALLGHRAGAVPLLGERLPVRSTGNEGDWANGAVVLVPAKVRNHVGPWREDLFLYCEEVDYCRRVTDAGWRVRQVSTATAEHRGGDVVRFPRLWAQLMTNKVVHAARWNGQVTARLVWAALVVGQLIRLPLRRSIHRHALAALVAGRRRLLAGDPTHPALSPELQRALPAPEGDR